MQKPTVLDINDFYLTSIHSLPLPFLLTISNVPLRDCLSVSVPEVGVAEPPLHAPHPRTHTRDPSLANLHVLSSWPSDASEVST